MESEWIIYSDNKTECFDMSDNLSSPEVKKKINYQICCLCQKGSRSDKQIRKPYTRTQNHGSYTAIEKEIHVSINDGYILPFELSATMLDNRNGIANTLQGVSAHREPTFCLIINQP